MEAAARAVRSASLHAVYGAISVLTELKHFSRRGWGVDQVCHLLILICVGDPGKCSCSMPGSAIQQFPGGFDDVVDGVAVHAGSGGNRGDRDFLIPQAQHFSGLLD